MNTKKQIGIVCLAIAAALTLWTIARFTSFVGKLHSWSPPFDEYEIYTLVGAFTALGLVVLGIRMFSGEKKPERKDPVG